MAKKTKRQEREPNDRGEHLAAIVLLVKRFRSKGYQEDEIQQAVEEYTMAISYKWILFLAAGSLIRAANEIIELAATPKGAKNEA